MALKDHPHLNKAYEALQADKKEVLAKSTPLREKRDKLLAKIQPVLDEIKELEREYREIEKPLYDIDNQIGAIARAAGAKSFGQEAARVESERQAAQSR